MRIDLPFWRNASPKQKRVYSTIFVLILSVLATLCGMLVPLSAEDAQFITSQLNQTVAENTASGTLIPAIFLNNLPLCLLMFIPLAGFAIGLFILFSTGIAFRAVFDVQAASSISSVSPDVQASTAILLLILVGVVFLIEYVSYAIGMTESIWLFRRLIQKRFSELKYTAILVGVVALLLLIGAVVETLALVLPI